ncbi:MAG: hypothetical protein QFE16_12635 [Pseudomonadota bacterium]|nr:hypothetical protein [Pseudomonadota bacterium]
MLSFQFTRHPPPAAAGPSPSSADKPVRKSGAPDCKPLLPPADTRGWYDSSADLKGGLQVQEEDFDSLPPEYRDAFPSR